MHAHSSHPGVSVWRPWAQEAVLIHHPALAFPSAALTTPCAKTCFLLLSPGGWDLPGSGTLPHTGRAVSRIC